MAKNSIRDYSATAGSNTDIQSVNIDESCPASGINNAIREVMADLKDVSTGTVKLETPGADQLNVDNIRIDGNTISSTDTNGDITLDPDGTGRVAVTGSVGISTTAPVANLEVEDGGTSNSILTKITADDQNPYALMIGNDSYSTTDTNAFGFLQRDDGAAYIYNAGSMRLVVDTDGDLGIGGTPGNIRFKISNTENKITQFIHTSNASYSDNILEMETVRGQSDVFNHILIRTNNGGDAEFKVRGDGQVTADGAFTGGGADYAEYFEWADGNSSNEDRRGYSVVLDGNKIRKATSDDAAASIIGIVSANPAVVGDSRWNKWHGKHEMDDYGTVVTETCSFVTWTEAPADETAAPVTHTYYTDRVPDGITVQDDAVVTANQTRPKESSSYDASVPYIPREERKEWDAIGMMGKLRMRVGQPTGDRWIKLRDISSDVEEWLVR